MAISLITTRPLQSFEHLSAHLGLSEGELSTLGYIDRLNECSSLIKTESCIAICGAWGSGKTTFFNCVAEISEPECYIISKSVFSFGSITEFIQELLSDVGILVEKRTGKKALKYFSRISQKATPDQAELEANVLFAKFKTTRSFSLATYLHKDSEYYKSKLDELLSRLDRRLVIFIDDLDRLLPEEVTFVLRFAEQLKEHSNLCIVFAVDMHSLNLLLERSNLANPLKYLEKIIDVELDLDFSPYRLLEFICKKQHLSSLMSSHLRKALIFELTKHLYTRRLYMAVEKEQRAVDEGDGARAFRGVFTKSQILVRSGNKFKAANHREGRNGNNIWLYRDKGKKVVNLSQNPLLVALNLPAYTLEEKRRLLNLEDALDSVGLLYESVALQSELGQLSEFKDAHIAEEMTFGAPIKDSGKIIDLFLSTKPEDIEVDFSTILTARLSVKIARDLQRSNIKQLKSRFEIHKIVSRVVSSRVREVSARSF